MPPAYNPIVRTFCRFRAVLVDALGVDRCRVRPATPLDALIPVEQRASFFARLRQAGLQAPELERQVVDYPLCGVAVLAVSGALIVSMALGPWAALIALPPTLALVWLGCAVKRTRVVQIPLGPRTVGEMVVYLTRFGEHPGYRFSRRETALKVRLVVAASLGVPLDRVREEDSFLDLDAD